MSKLGIRIYYGDTDCGGVVYYARYLEYFERGRTEYMLERGIDIADCASEGIKFAVVRTSVEYISPARYGDIIIVDTSLEAVKGVRLGFSTLVTLQGCGREIVRGNTELVCVGSGFKPRRIPDAVITKLSCPL